MYDVLLSGVSENREKFLQVRTGRIGSSDIAAICGLNKYDSPLDVWARMTGRKEPPVESDEMWMGKLQERTIGALCKRKLGEGDVIAVNEVWANPKYPLAIASPDFLHSLNNEVSMIEAKNHGWHERENWGESKAPDSTQIQLNWQQGVGGIASGYCAGLLGNKYRDFHLPKFDFSQDIFDQTYEKALAFMEMVKSDTPPSARAGDLELLDLIYADKKDGICDLEEATELLEMFDELKEDKSKHTAAIKPLDDEIDRIKAELARLMGGYKYGKTGRWNVSYEFVKRKGYPVAPSEKWQIKIKGE